MQHDRNELPFGWSPGTGIILVKEIAPGMEQLKVRLMSAERPELLRLLAAVIVELTVRGRSYYDSPDVVERLRETNEAIHRIAGHLRDLSEGEAIFTTSRADGVLE